MLTSSLTRLLPLRFHLEEHLPDFLRARRWFGGKARRLRAVSVEDIIPLEVPEALSYFLLLRVHYQEGQDNLLSVPMIEVATTSPIPRDAAGRPAAHVEIAEDSVVLYDAMANPRFLAWLLQSLRERRSFTGQAGELRAVRSPALDGIAGAIALDLQPRLMHAEQSNTSVLYGDRLVLKLFRRVEPGINPDIEIGQFLWGKTAFRNVPPLAGYFEYRRGAARASLAILQGYVPNRGDAWEFTLQAVRRYLARTKQSAQPHPPVVPSASLLDMAERGVPPELEREIGDYVKSAALLGQRTAELHCALAASRGDPAFDPEPFTHADQQALCRDALRLLQSNLDLLRHKVSDLEQDAQDLAHRVLRNQSVLEGGVQSVADCPLTALRTRIHGDYHLGQVLVSENDFVIIDFEGEPARPLAQRRAKRSPLQDVAGMLRSFQYAAYAAFANAEVEDIPLATAVPWARAWQYWISVSFLRAYLGTSEGAAFIPSDRRASAALLQLHLVEKAAYELGYELNNRPGWVQIPLSGLAQLLADGA